MSGADTRAPVGRAALRAGPVLGLFALVSAGLLSLVHDLTYAPIAARKSEDLAAALAQVIPPELHDNDPVADRRLLTDAADGAVTAFVATKDGAVTAIAFERVGQGYSGAIRVLMGVAPDGTVLGVRMLAHSETPGLGDRIDVARDAWVLGFDGRSLRDPAPEGWRVQRDGGVFDQFAGATISPRAVVATVHRGLTLFERHRETLTAPPIPTP